MADPIVELENRVTKLEQTFQAMVTTFTADDKEPDGDGDDQNPPQVPPEGPPVSKG